MPLHTLIHRDCLAQMSGTAGCRLRKNEVYRCDAMQFYLEVKCIYKGLVVVQALILVIRLARDQATTSGVFLL